MGRTIIFLLFVTPAIVFAAEDILAQWQPFGLQDQKVYSISVFDGALYAGTKNGLYRKQLSGGNWTQLLNGKIVSEMLVLHKDTILVSVAQGQTGDPYAAGIFRTTNGGQQWERFQSGFQTFENVPITPFVMVEAPSSSTIFATGSYLIAKSTNRGRTWQPVTGGYDMIGMGTHFITFDPSNPQNVWSGGENTILQPYILKSTDSGNNWNNIQIDVGGDNACYDLAVDYTNSNAVYVGMEGLIIKTVDGGQEWKTVFSPTTQPYFYGIETTPRDQNVVYAVGASNTHDPMPLKLYISTNKGDSWQTYTAPDVSDGEALDMVLVSDASDDSLYIATVTGVYRCTFEAPSSAGSIPQQTNANAKLLAKYNKIGRAHV
jgi:photosystem II stability/assembly factor-like uncharacterized protein